MPKMWKVHEQLTTDVGSQVIGIAHMHFGSGELKN